MIMKTTPIALALLISLPLNLQAQVSTSNSYSLLHSDPNSAGASLSNASGTIKAEVSTGDSIASTPPTGTIQARANFTTLLYDPISLEITATSAPINEGRTTKFRTTAIMDDETTLEISSSDVTWTILSGPITNITPAGLAISALVYQDETALIQGTWQEIAGAESLSVLNTNDDNFGSYANDGLDDWWQVGYFGLDNPDAAPDQDPDGDQQTNAFENLAGIDPTDSSSFFKVRIEQDAESPNKRKILFSPFFADRTYTLLATPNLMNTFIEVNDVTSSNTGNGGEAEITDVSALEILKFYRIGISK